MGVALKRRILVRGLTRSLRRVDGLGTSFRVVVGSDGHAVVEAETLEPATDAQLASLSSKLLDALTDELSDVAEEAAAADARARLTLRVLPPGSLARSTNGRRVRPSSPVRIRVH